MKYDFSGYVTKNDLKCSDGVTINPNAFKDCDGKTVPLVWQHDRSTPKDVLGHVLLENRSDGVYGYVKLNSSVLGVTTKELVSHGDFNSFSIFANKIQKLGMDVVHGMIREVSLVVLGANPGALIDYMVMEHSDSASDSEEAIIYVGEKFTISPADRCVREYTLQTLKVDDLEYQRRMLTRELSESLRLTDSRKMHIEKIIWSLGAQIAWHKKRAKHWARCANLNSPIGQPAVII